LIYSQLLYPFVDVFCFYAYSLQDLQKIATQLGSWTESGQPGARSAYPPQLFIVLGYGSWLNEDVHAAMERFESQMTDAMAGTLRLLFPEVVFLRATDEDPLTGIRQSLLPRLQDVRRQRRRAHALFSTRHFNSLFERAFSAITGAPSFAFSPLTAARKDLPVAADMSSHVKVFLACPVFPQRLEDFAVPVIASCILKDQYPPGMHCKYPSTSKMPQLTP
jgi:hypothetical protein